MRKKLYVAGVLLVGSLSFAIIKPMNNSAHPSSSISTITTGTGKEISVVHSPYYDHQRYIVIKDSLSAIDAKNSISVRLDSVGGGDIVFSVDAYQLDQDNEFGGEVGGELNLQFSTGNKESWLKAKALEWARIIGSCAYRDVYISFRMRSSPDNTVLYIHLVNQGPIYFNTFDP